MRSASGKRLRVLHVIDTIGVGGGAESNFAAVVPRMHDFEHTVVHFRPEDEYAPGLRAAGIDVRRIALEHPWDLPVVLRNLAQLARQVDVVHTQTLQADLWGRLAATFSKPIVTTVQIPAYESQIVSNYSLPGKLKTAGLWAADTILSRRAKHMVCVSEYVRQTVVERLHVPRSRTSVIYNAVPIEQLRTLKGQERQAVRNQIGLPQSAFVIISVGKLSWIKGQEVLLEALPAIVSARPEAMLVLVGTGERKAQLERRAAQLGLSDRVRLLGLRQDVPRILAVADLFALASRTEGLSLAVAEAMASSLPVVLSNIPPHLEMQRCVSEFSPESAAGMITQRTPEDFATRIARLSTDGDALLALGRSCRQAAEKHFNADLTALALTSILSSAARDAHSSGHINQPQH